MIDPTMHGIKALFCLLLFIAARGLKSANSEGHVSHCSEDDEEECFVKEVLESVMQTKWVPIFSWIHKRLDSLNSTQAWLLRHVGLLMDVTFQNAQPKENETEQNNTLENGRAAIPDESNTGPGKVLALNHTQETREIAILLGNETETKVSSLKCADNPFFVNCALIVKTTYCTTNTYYCRFFCLSCLQACGQLSLPLPLSCLS